MGNILFGLDIAKIVNAEIQKAGGVLDGTLTKTTPGTRTPGDLTGGTNPTTTTHSFKGFMETTEERREGMLEATILTKVSILGDSLSPSTVPEVNDEVEIEGSSFILYKLVNRDPAAALYEFETEAL